jgi:mannose-6-phosphate isomerase-like protein (cupin superfamily)
MSTRQILLVFFFLVLPAAAQVAPHPSVATNGAGGNTFASPADVRYPPKLNDSDRDADMFFSDWRESMPRVELGSLVLRDILTCGSNDNPPRRGAVLEIANFLAHGDLTAGASTEKTTLKGVQQVFYITSGQGEVTTAAKHGDLHRDIAFFIPEGVPFTIHNTGAEPLEMYVIEDPVPAGFHPIADMLVTDERKVELRTPLVPSPYTLPGASGHWAHIVRDLFNKRDGLATVGDVITVEINPMSMGEPHPHQLRHEEIWLAMDGDSLAFYGSQLRVQHPGTAYMLRPDGNLVHSNINTGDKPVKFLWFSTNLGNRPAAK